MRSSLVGWIDGCIGVVVGVGAGNTWHEDEYRFGSGGFFKSRGYDYNVK